MWNGTGFEFGVEVGGERGYEGYDDVVCGCSGSGEGWGSGGGGFGGGKEGVEEEELGIDGL